MDLVTLIYAIVGICIFVAGALFMQYISNYSKIPNSSNNAELDIPFFVPEKKEYETEIEKKKKKEIEDEDNIFYQ